MSYYRGGGGRGRGGGRGDYYKNKYGNGGGRGGDSYYGNGGGGRGDSYGNGGRGDYGNGGGGGGSRGGWSSPQPPPIATQPLYGDFNNPATGGGSYFDLEKALTNMDGKPYGAYHELDTPYPRGWVNKARKFTLYIEKAQSDPFASPTRCRIEVDSRRARIPVAFTSNKIRRVAVGDFLLRTMYENIKRMGMDSELPSSGWSGPKGGEISILEPCQHVLEQSAVYVDKYGQVKAQFTINLPARGRNIMGEAAWEIFDQKLPDIIESSLIYDALDPEAMDFHVKSVEDQAWLRDVLASRKLVGFIPNGAILPRVSGADDRPMQSSPIRFKSPKEFEVSFRLPNGGTELFGMGIPKGITLICGGGFHGKSTLLTALEYGIYPKVPGDGREFCAAAPKAVKIRAEDGRAVEAVDISTFIHNLPFGRETTCFSTPDASGSTSQAANIIESIEMGADLLLVDEDTCATNFMIRDEKMMQLVKNDPITPFLHVVRSMFDDFGISTIMVLGGAGDYFDVADNVIMMDCYQCHDVTDKAKELVDSVAGSIVLKSPSHGVAFRKGEKRYPRASAFSSRGKAKVHSKNVITYGDTELDISGLEQVVTKSQTNAIVNALQNMPLFAAGGTMTLREALQSMDQKIDQDGLDVLCPNQFDGEMARPRILEIAGAANRLRRDNKVRQKR